MDIYLKVKIVLVSEDDPSQPTSTHVYTLKGGLMGPVGIKVGKQNRLKNACLNY